MTPLSAARRAMGVTPAPADPNAPGPFALADEERLRTILSGAGFGAIDVQRFDAAIFLGATPRSAAEGVVQMGPVSRLVREVGAEHLPIILDAVERAAPRFLRRMARAERLDLDRFGYESRVSCVARFLFS